MEKKVPTNPRCLILIRVYHLRLNVIFYSSDVQYHYYMYIVDYYTRYIKLLISEICFHFYSYLIGWRNVCRWIPSVAVDGNQWSCGYFCHSCDRKCFYARRFVHDVVHGNHFLDSCQCQYDSILALGYESWCTSAASPFRNVTSECRHAGNSSVQPSRRRTQTSGEHRFSSMML